MGFNVTVTPIVQEVEISANVTPYEVQVTANQDLIDYVNEAKQSADQAEASAISADNSADSALASATSATASANSASSSASSASSSASTATTQAGIATTKANEASQSATNALASEQASAISEANALASEQASAQSEANALSSEQNALASEQASALSASNALASENSASASASTATTQAGISTTQAGIATTQASNALASANAAALSASQASQVGTSTILSGFSVGANSTIASTDSILQAFNKTQGQINARVSGTGTSGQVSFWNGTTSQTGDAGLTWNNTTKTLDIGSGGTARKMFLTSSGSLGANYIDFVNTTGRQGYIGYGNSIDDDFIILQNKNSPIRFATNALTRWSILATGILQSTGTQTIQTSTGLLSLQANGGNIGINTTTDAGFRLDVAGSTRIVPPANTTGLTLSGYSLTGSDVTPAIDISGTFNTTGQANAIRVNITNTASGTASNLLNLQVGGTSIFRVQTSNIGGFTGGGPIAINGYGFGSGTTAIYLVNSSNSVINSSGTAINFSDDSASLSGYSYYFFSQQYVNRTYTSGTGGFVSIQRNFAPTSGTGVLNVLNLQNTINQTGGANGITRGLLINPTLTSAADWRSIEWSNNTGWGLYGTGTAPNYLNGNLLIGSTANNAKLYVAGGISGTNQRMITVQPFITNAQDTLVNFNSAVLGSASVTVTNLIHFNALAGVPSPSTYTNNYGFNVANSFTFGTFNYGFYGDIPSGAGRWNLFMNGTANNYLRGNLLLNTTTDAGFLLDVNGTARFSNDVTIADTRNIILSTTTGTRIGTATNQRLSLWNATPNVQPTNAITAAAFVANTSGIVNDTATFGGYTIGQIVAALQRIGALA